VVRFTHSDATELTIDELAVATGTTTRSIRSWQTLGLLDHPDLRGRTGMYGARHVERLHAILLLQSRGFSLQSLAILFAAHRQGESLGSILGLADTDEAKHPSRPPDTDDAERYGFSELQRNRRNRPLLAVVPTTMWNETEAS
jgi:DNA-binding transcriptional MerR regulator